MLIRFFFFPEIQNCARGRARAAVSTQTRRHCTLLNPFLLLNPTTQPCFRTVRDPLFNHT